MWWIYFWPSHHHAIRSFRDALRYGYTHFILFMAIAAYAAGVELVSAKLKEGEELRIPYYQASLTVTVPVGVFLLGIWWILIHRCAVPVVKKPGPRLGLFDAAGRGDFRIRRDKIPHDPHHHIYCH